MGDEEGVSVAIAHAILDALRDQGVDVDATLASAGIAPADLEDLDGLISVAREEALCHKPHKPRLHFEGAIPGPDRFEQIDLDL